ncbi:carboxypeptidase A6 [Sesamum indicum]|uniref:Carboxypeptidase A6 n=1 Tax=Sesamum indicum TaxID=4182 RepID=A0A6I9UNX5_SESIN|nr:carboxypeptidase A6 [Sesamum indicum]
MGLHRRLNLLSNLLIFASFVLFANHFTLTYGKSNGTLHLDVTPINHDLYHTSGALLEEIESLVHRHPDKLSIEKVSSKNKGYEAQMTVVTYRQKWKESDDRTKLRILLTFGQHARELITTELALRLLSILSEEQFLPNVDRSTLNRTLDRLIIKVVPVENLNGRKRVEDGELCERRNGRGVDLNRNWSVDWGKKEKDYDPYEENPGPAPFSEPESQIMRKLSVSFEPHIWVNVHSGMEALFMPYDHKNTTPDGIPYQIMKSMLDDLNHFYLRDHCLVGSGGASVGYLAHGTATDYMYDIARVPMAFTFEIYGDLKASSKDCFRMFNPIDITSFNRVLNDWSAAFFQMFSIGVQQMDGVQSKAIASRFDNWVSIDDYLNGYLMHRKSRYAKKMEVLDLGLQEIRAYFRLFLLSSVLLLFMFCSRISKSTRPIVSGMSL